jgi:hypothetical protein
MCLGHQVSIGINRLGASGCNPQPTPASLDLDSGHQQVIILTSSKRMVGSGGTPVLLFAQGVSSFKSNPDSIIYLYFKHF